MKIAFAAIGGLIALLVVAFIAFDFWMFGGESAKRSEAIRAAEGLREDRCERLVADCLDLAQGKPFSVPPYENGEYSVMWDRKSGYPREFEDLKPMRIYREPDAVSVMTYKCFDEAVEIEVSGLSGLSPVVKLVYGDYAKPIEKVLWKKAAEPGATDNPDDAKGLREDH